MPEIFDQSVANQFGATDLKIPGKSIQLADDVFREPECEEVVLSHCDTVSHFFHFGKTSATSHAKMST